MKTVRSMAWIAFFLFAVVSTVEWLHWLHSGALLQGQIQSELLQSELDIDVSEQCTYQETQPIHFALRNPEKLVLRCAAHIENSMPIWPFYAEVVVDDRESIDRLYRFFDITPVSQG